MQQAAVRFHDQDALDCTTRTWPVLAAFLSAPLLPAAAGEPRPVLPTVTVRGSVRDAAVPPPSSRFVAGIFRGDGRGFRQVCGRQGLPFVSELVYNART